MIRDVVAAHLPGYRVRAVEQIGEGLDNLAFEVNGELIVRVSRQPDPARIRGEARLLAAVAGISPVPVPDPVFTDPGSGCLAYFKLDGVPLLELPAGARALHGPSIAGRLGELLGVLHAEPAGRWTELVDLDDQPPAEWRDEAAQTYPAVADWVPVKCRKEIEAFLDAPLPTERDAMVFSHNDLGIEHVLVDPARWTVTGVIDWSDAAIADPARDFGLVYRDLGDVALDAALDRYGFRDRAGLRERAVFHGRCSVFEDLAYGVQTGRQQYIDKCLTAMEWLF
jgi:aminoglycoside phosphotransferase (APT) family kinase protein